MDEAFTRRSALEDRFEGLLQRRESESKLRTLKSSPSNSVDLSSNDFLSLSTSQDLKSRLLQELSNPTLKLGSTGSRLLDGNSAYAEELERDIALFHGGKAGLLANSGFDANVGLFSCLPQPGDVILYDELIHASVHDGMKVSRAEKFVPFEHNSVADLAVKLKSCITTDDLVRRGQKNVFIAIETVYSMEGDLAPLTEVVEVVEEMLPEGNGHLIVDEAHSTGIYGAQGKGRVCELGLQERVFARLHTFGKALACNGGESSKGFSLGVTAWTHTWP